MKFTRTATPTDLSIISLADAKAHCRVTHTEDDAYITTLISAARQWVEIYCNCWMNNTTGVGYIDRWPEGEYIDIPLHPVTAIASVQYVDSAGSLTSMPSGDIQTDVITVPARVFLETTYSLQDGPNKVRVNFTAGFTEATVPKAMRQAMLILILGMYEQRQPSVVGAIVSEMKGYATIDQLLSPFRIFKP
jgi:uncharacterized phiE125 gp8 family phage protein